VLPPERGAEILLDLEDLHAARVATTGRQAADRWYRRQVLGFVWRSLPGGRATYRNRTAGNVRGRRRTMRIETLGADVRFALRRMRRTPGFTAIALLSLALGIGANTAIFSLVKGVLFTRAAVEEPESLVNLYLRSPGFPYATFSYPEYVDMERATGDVLAAVAGSKFAFTQREVDGGVETVPAELVTGQYFTLRGIRPALGRLLTPEDDVSPGGHPVVVLSHSFWQRAFGGDAAIVGNELRLNGQTYTVVGVAPATYTGQIHGLSPSVYLPMMMINRVDVGTGDQLEQRSSRSIFAAGRLVEGRGMPALNAALAAYREDMRAGHPDTWVAENEVIPVPLLDVIINPGMDRVIVAASGLLTMVVGLVLLVACANLASFLLAQGRMRRKEVAIRLALGAGRGRLVRQLLTETVLLSLAGGVAGAFVAVTLLGALMNADLSLPFPITVDLAPDAGVFAFTFAISLVAGMLFGLAPALQSTNPALAPTLKDEAMGGRRSRVNLRALLVSGQMAASIVLLVTAGLFVRSLAARTDIRPGFGDAPTAVVGIGVPPDRYEPAEARLFISRALEEIERLPGVQAAGVTSNLHLNLLNTNWMDIHVDGHVPPDGQPAFFVDNAIADAGFFEAAGIELLEGRLFDDGSDIVDGPGVVIVNQAFVDRFWPGESGVGRMVRTSQNEVTVVGVVETVKIRTLGEAPRPFVYRPYSQRYGTYLTVLARTDGNASALAQQVFVTLRQMEPDLLFMETKTVERHVSVHIVPFRLGALVIGAVALLALLLAIIGLYGIVSHAVASRTREMGIRMSLGADRRRVVLTMMTGGLRLVLVGGIAGIALAAAVASLLRSLLYGVEPFDPITFVGVPLLLGGASILAAWLPARRASRIDPVRALRTE
jgi:predicted permease